MPAHPLGLEWRNVNEPLQAVLPGSEIDEPSVGVPVAKLVIQGEPIVPPRNWPRHYKEIPSTVNITMLHVKRQVLEESS